jgi:16S rRNA (adenine1518-N6/adenine1519-N6)-dimethyltransferase
VDSITPTRARELLERHGLAARKSLGQHFLIDPNTARRIVRLAKVEPGEPVLEIGPGLGSLTLALAEAGARVTALEVDRGLAEALRGIVPGTVEVRVGDAMTQDLDGLLDSPGRLVANLPYNLATPILARVLEEAPRIGAGLVMTQLELAERWTAPPGTKTYGSFSVKLAYHARARIAGRVPPTVFMPRPKVSSALVEFVRRPPPVEVSDPSAFLDFVDSCFGHRRKTIRNALVGMGLAPGAAAAALEGARVSASSRPEQLAIADFAALFAVSRSAA